MTGANMNLVTVNVKLGENDEEPEQHLDDVCPPNSYGDDLMECMKQGEHIVRKVVALKDLHSTLQGMRQV